jgi:phosphoserine phosphatase RsbU/P
MSIKKGLSIKYKLLIVLTSLPLFMLGSYLFLAIGIFKDDKIAYIFESSSSVAKSISAQVSTELNSSLVSVRPLMQELIAKGKFDQVSTGFFETEGPVQWIVAYQKDNVIGDYKIVDQQERSTGLLDSQKNKIKNFDQIVLQTAATSRVVQAPFGDDNILISEKIFEKSTIAGGVDLDFVFVLIVRMSQLQSTFKTPGTVENYLVNSDGEYLFGTKEIEEKNLNKKLGVKYFKNTKEQKFTNGAETIKSSGSEDLLVSYAKLAIGDLMVVSIVEQKEALKAINTLISRSLVFLFALLSLTVIISLFASNNLTSALRDLFLATKKVSEGNFDVKVNVQSGDEIGSLAESFNVMADEVARLMSETAEKARMESELKTAQTVQETLFPPTRAEWNGLRVAGFYEPASECGGDWWYYNSVAGKYFFWIGDATGHGAPAALITSAAKSAATIIESLNVSPKEAMALLNRSIFEVSKGRIMMTFFLGCYDPKTRELTYANASHEAPFLIKKSEKALKKKDLIPLNEVNSPRLGQAADTSYDQTTVTLDVGDRIFFYTDGIPDIQNPELVSWGEREFVKTIVSTNSDFKPVNEVVQNFAEIFSTYRQSTALIDDITFFMIESTEAPALESQA